MLSFYTDFFVGLNYRTCAEIATGAHFQQLVKLINKRQNIDRISRSNVTPACQQGRTIRNLEAIVKNWELLFRKTWNDFFWQTVYSSGAVTRHPIAEIITNFGGQSFIG